MRADVIILGGGIAGLSAAVMLRARISDGAVVTDRYMRTTIKGLYAAGCVTPANCQMIIAAGQGAAAAQSINREIFKQGLRS